MPVAPEKSRPYSRHVARLLASLFVAVVFGARIAAIQPPALRIDARALQPGELVRLTITLPTSAEDVNVRAFGQTWPAYRDDETTWTALIGIDLDVAPKRYTVEIASAAFSAGLTSSGRPVIITATTGMPCALSFFIVA